MAEDARRSFDLKSWQGLTEVLKFARESNLTPEEYGAFRNLVLEYAQQKGADPALKRKIDDLILSFYEAREKGEEEKDTKKKPHGKKEERVGRRVIPSFMPTFSQVESLDEKVEEKEEKPKAPEPVAPPQPSAPPVATPPPPTPVPVVVVAPTSAPVSAELKSIEEHRLRIMDIKRRVNALVGNPIALVDHGNTIGRDYMGALLNALKATSPGTTLNAEEAMEALETSFGRILEYGARLKGGGQPEPVASPLPVSPQASPVVAPLPPAPVSPPPPPSAVVSSEPLPEVTPPVAIPPSQPYVRRVPITQEEEPVVEYAPPQTLPPLPVEEPPEVVEEILPPQAPTPVPQAVPYTSPLPDTEEVISQPPPEPLPETVPEPQSETVFVSHQEPVAPSVEFFAVPEEEIHDLTPTQSPRVEEHEEEKVVTLDDAFVSRTLGDISENGLVSKQQEQTLDVTDKERTPTEEVQPSAVYEKANESAEDDPRWNSPESGSSLAEQIQELRRQLHETEQVPHETHMTPVPSLIDMEDALPGGDFRADDTPHAYQAPEELSPRDLAKRPESSLTGITLGTTQAELVSPDVTMALTELLHEWNIFASSGFLGMGPGGIEHPLYVKLSGLPMGEVLAGRYEGVDMKVVHTIKEYVDAWRHEQGIAYNPTETFEHYLRRVSQRILKRQQGIRDY